MAWAKCKSMIDSSKTIWINLDQVTMLADSSKGSSITFVNGHEIVVADHPEEIFSLVENEAKK